MNNIKVETVELACAIVGMDEDEALETVVAFLGGDVDWNKYLVEILHQRCSAETIATVMKDIGITLDHYDLTDASLERKALLCGALTNVKGYITVNEEAPPNES